MKRSPLAPGLLILLGSPLLAAATAGEIDWQADFAATLDRAKSEGRVVFVAVNMDGERANDQLAADTYKEKAIVSLSDRCLSLVASNSKHKDSGTCPRFGTIECAEHRAVDIRVREKVLKPDSEGYVISPQHVFLGPDGKVLLSVPYQVSSAELEWCFVKALTMVDPKTDAKASSRARAPKRLLMEDVIDTSLSGEAGTTPGSPATREEVLELIKEIKKGKSPDRAAKLRRIMTADEPEARDCISQELRSLKSRGDDPGRRHRDLLADIGRLSPASYWELVAELAENSMSDVRASAAAAFEQLAAPESLKTLKAVLRKEKEPVLVGNWLRAMASSAPEDKKLRKDLLKNAEKAKDVSVRIQSIVALGYLVEGEDVREAIASAFEGQDPEFAKAAACAMAISRDSKWLEALNAKAGEAPPGSLGTTISAAIEVLTKGRLEPLCGPLMEVCGDPIARPRFFGHAPQ